MTIDSAPFQALDARSGAEVRLAMQSLWLSGRVLPAGARLMVRHVFRSRWCTRSGCRATPPCAGFE